MQRIGTDGTPQGQVPGQFVGISSTGVVAVADGPGTRLLSGPGLETAAIIPATYTSVVWAPDNARYAATHFEGDSIDLADGAARRTVTVGDITPRMLAWSPDGRFVLVAGEIASDPVIVFVDSATLDTRTVLVDAHPLAARVVP